MLRQGTPRRSSGASGSPLRPLAGLVNRALSAWWSACRSGHDVALALTARDGQSSASVGRGPSRGARPSTEELHETRGRHLIVELHGCDARRLCSAALLRSTMLAAARDAGARVIDLRFHSFGPSRGISGVILLAESHLSIHTWPEAGYVAADIYTCGRHVRPERASSALARALAAKHLTVTEVRRGELTASNVHSHSVLRTEHSVIQPSAGTASW